MITIKPAINPTISNQKTGLALAGGGPLGGFYELGALCAIEDSINPLDLNKLEVYVGVSVGSFIAAGLANQIKLDEMAEIFALNKKAETPFNPDNFLRPAFKEYIRNIAKTPGLITQGLLSWAKNPLKTSIVDLLETAGKALPAGIFSNDKLEQFLRQLFTQKGRTNDFRKLNNSLHIIAAELNTGQIASFSKHNNSDVCISKAAQASSALPGLYPPVEIKERLFVDGALRRTMNASAALDEGVNLLFAVNPIVPFKTNGTKKDPQSVIHGGLPLLLSQTFRSIVQSRLKSGLDKYDAQYPKADIVLIEPDANDALMFNTNIFSYAKRAELTNYAYQLTRKQLLKQHNEVDRALMRHGFSLDLEKLKNQEKTLTDFIQNKDTRCKAVEHMNHSLDDLERTIRNLGA